LITLAYYNTIKHSFTVWESDEVVIVDGLVVVRAGLSCKIR
jgi:hypothetical protein